MRYKFKKDEFEEDEDEALLYTEVSIDGHEIYNTHVAENGNREKISVPYEVVFQNSYGSEKPEENQIKTLDYIVENFGEIEHKISQYIYKEREILQNVYGYNQENNWFNLKNSKTSFGIYKIYIDYTGKGDICYYGLVGSCKWDSEHGLGVRMFKDKVLELGGYGTGENTYGTDEKSTN